MKPNIHSLFISCLISSGSWGKYLALSCSTVLTTLVSISVCVQCGAGQVVYTGFIKAFCWKQQPAVAKNNPDESCGIEPKQYNNGPCEAL